MTPVTYAAVCEQNVTFVVVNVRDSVITSRAQADRLISTFCDYFCCPVVLLGDRSCRYYGRTDIVRFLSSVHPSRLRWKKVSIAA